MTSDASRFEAAPASPAGEAPVGGDASLRAALTDAASFLAPRILMGILCGALIGGVVGRLAMFVLRLTSDDSLRGMKTDDEFTIGAFTADTAFLVAIAAVIGGGGALIYLGVREWLPQRWRPALFGLLGATVGGQAIILPDGIDFTLVEPHWLAVAMFVAIPAAYGVSISLLVEHPIGLTRLRRSRWRWLAVFPLGIMALTGPFGLAAIAVIAVVVAANRSGGVTRLWRSTPVTWLGRSAFAIAASAGGVQLARDVTAVL